MTSTNKYELHSPWYFAIVQMSAGQGPGFPCRTTSCEYMPPQELSSNFSQTYDQPPIPGPAVMASVPGISDAALPLRYGGV